MRAGNLLEWREILLYFKMAATKSGQKLDGEMSSKDTPTEEFSNIFASEFNNSDMHDRVMCFQIIKDNEFSIKNDEAFLETFKKNGNVFAHLY